MSDKALTIADRMETVIYQYMNLYDRWSEDRQVFAKKGADIAKALEALSHEVNRLESIDARVKASLESQLKTVILKTQEAIVEASTKEVKQGLSRAIKQLESVVTDTDRTLRQSIWEVTKSRLQWFSLTILCAVLSSLVFNWWLLPNNLSSLSTNEINLMNIGSDFTLVWAQLPDAEQKAWLDKLSTVKRDQYQ